MLQWLKFIYLFNALYRVRQILFFLEKALKKKLLNIFSNFFFYLKVQSFRLIMENNFIQMPYTIGWIFKHIIDCVQLYAVLKNWTDRVGYCMANRGSYVNEIICHY